MQRVCRKVPLQGLHAGHQRSQYALGNYGGHRGSSGCFKVAVGHERGAVGSVALPRHKSEFD